MCISRKGNNKLKVYVDEQQVEQVSQIRYLGNSVSEDGYCTKEIRSRIEMAKKVFMEKKKLYR